MSDSGGFDLCAFPAAPPPGGLKSNFVNPQSLAPASITICAVGMAMAIIFTVGRLIANQKRLVWSDHFCWMALILSLAQGGLMLAQLDYARHQWDVPACWFLGSRGGWYAKILFSQQMMLVPGLFFSKASIFLLFQQIFTLEDTMQVAIWIGLVADFLVHFTSIPVEAYFNAPAAGDSWDGVMLSGKPQRAIYWGIVQSALSILLDSYIFILPLPIIARLTLSPKKRIKVIAVFSTAFMGVVANVVSLVYRVMELVDPVDETWNLCALLLCTVVELNIAIIVSSVPGFSKFVRVYVSDWAPFRSLRTKLSISEPSSSAESSNARNKPRTGRDDSGRHRYVELNEAWLMKTGATMELTNTTRTDTAGPSGEITTMPDVVLPRDDGQASSAPHDIERGSGT